MRQSALFTKTRRQAPADEVAKNAQLLIRAGYVHKEMAGVYSYLPLGLRVLKNIEQIIREEMDAIGGQELFLSALQDRDIWAKTGRWEGQAVTNWFKTKLQGGADIGLAFTHEEPLTRIMTEQVASYRDLPTLAYQFQTKFRNEARAKSGVIRGREFIMKDLYSFAKDEEEHRTLFGKVRDAYQKVFVRLGIGKKTYVTSASGGVFSKEFSEEFQTLSDAGEDTILVNEEKHIAINKEVAEEALSRLGMKSSDFVERKAIESGNIFHLGTKFSEPLGLKYKDEEGNIKPVIMGSYGLGVTRLMGTLTEVLADEKGLVWPEEVAPFKYHLVSVGQKGDEASKMADDLYDGMVKRNMSVLYDDRDARAGEKFADSDLIGIPWRIVVGKEALSSGQFEMVNRASGEVARLSEGEILAL